jgi:hypothetical protein
VNAVRRLRQGRRRWAALSAVMVLGTILPLAPAGLASSAGAVSTPYSVTATPTTGLTDGQRVTINIKTQPGYPIYQAEARLCRHGVVYQGSSGNRPNADFEGGGPNCSPFAISSSADAASVDSAVVDQAATPAGNSMSIRVGSGVAAWPIEAPTNSLTCDADNPCTLVVELFGGPGPVVWTPWTTDITYRIDDPIAGCGGPARGVLATGGSDRMSDAWVNWTLAECKRNGRTGAAGRGSFQGEGLSLDSYTAGSLDLAYTALGYNADADLRATDAIPRKSVAVPIGVNATVLAVGGGFRDADAQKLPYQNLRLTLDEFTALVGGGTFSITPYLPAIEARNPELALSMFDSASPVKIGAYADAESTSWLATHFLSRLRPDLFRIPNLSIFGADAGRPHGDDANLALADPSYINALTLLTGRAALTKAVNTTDPSGSGGIWVVTDLETATTLGLTPVSIQNSAGQFVSPSAESMAAAVAVMSPDANGLLVSDPTVTGAGAVQPYPLTQVEYALVPAEPLADASGACRTESQALLHDWLTYITTDGQQVLPAGMQALPPAVAAQAAAAIAQVGATPAATPCRGGTMPTTTTPLGAAPIDSGAGGYGSGIGTGYPGSGYGGTGAGSYSSTTPGAAAPADPTKVELAAAASHIPDYGGGSLANSLLAALSIVGLVVLLSIAARYTSGRGGRRAGSA